MEDPKLATITPFNQTPGVNVDLSKIVQCYKSLVVNNIWSYAKVLNGTLQGYVISVFVWSPKMSVPAHLSLEGYQIEYDSGKYLTWNHPQGKATADAVTKNTNQNILFIFINILIIKIYPNMNYWVLLFYKGIILYFIKILK